MDGLLSEKRLARTAEEANAYAVTHGLVVGRDDGSVVHAPLTLLPSPVPLKDFQAIQALAADWNLLVDAVSRHPTFLNESLKSAAETDEFLRRLLDVYNTARKEGKPHGFQLALNRSDYMLQRETREGERVTPAHFVQVELNTISASLAGLSCRVGDMHRYLLSRHDTGAGLWRRAPPNGAIDRLSKALAMAIKQLGSDQAALLMVVQPNEKNFADQRWLEYALWHNHGIQTHRRTLAEVAATGRIEGAARDLVVDGVLVGVCYFRAGYTPRDFPGEAEWEALRLMERSRAILCPSTAFHLAGKKKIQQVVSMPGVLERFVPAESAARMRACITNLWPLENDDDATRQLIARVVAEPGKFVLKPQREGGGNNLWGAEMVRVLTTATPRERAAYVLMQRIEPVAHRNAAMRGGEVRVQEMFSEVGIYGCFLADAERVILNEAAGHLVRSKPVDVNEGGVVAGFAFMDSPLLHD